MSSIHTIKDTVNIYSVANIPKCQVAIYDYANARHVAAHGTIHFMEVAFTPGGVYWWHRYGIMLDVDIQRGYAISPETCRYYSDQEIFAI